MALYERNARPLWIYAYRVTGNAAEADDIVQETFARCIDAELPPGEENGRRYLFRVASNLATDRWRRAARQDSLIREMSVLAATTAAPAMPDGELVQTFEALKPRERALLWLAYVEGESHESIAHALQLRRSSIKVLLSRARGRLRDLLRARGVSGER